MLFKKNPVTIKVTSKLAILVTWMQTVETSRKWAAGQNEQQQHLITSTQPSWVTLEVAQVVQQGQHSKG